MEEVKKIVCTQNKKQKKKKQQHKRRDDDAKNLKNLLSRPPPPCCAATLRAQHALLSSTNNAVVVVEAALEMCVCDASSSSSPSSSSPGDSMMRGKRTARHERTTTTTTTTTTTRESRVVTPSLPKKGVESDVLVESFDASKASSSLHNEDLSPVIRSKRTFSTFDTASLWVGLVVCVPAWTLVSSLMALGNISAFMALSLVFVANLFVVWPIVLQASPGIKYGIPFVVHARSSFGVRGANVAGLSRGLIASVWFGIQTVVGAKCLKSLAVDLGVASSLVPYLDGLCYGIFWLAQAYVVWNDIESIKTIEKLAAPILLFLTLILFTFTCASSGGIVESVLTAFSANNSVMSGSGFSWKTFFQAATASASFWATMICNASDFSRFSKSDTSFKKASFAMPLAMVVFAFASIVVTSSTAQISNTSSNLITDPMVVTSLLSVHFNWGKMASVLAAVGILTATLSTNIAANILAPANAIQNLAPSRLSFRTSAILSMILGTLCLPWKLTGDASSYILVWLTGYGAFLAPILGIMLCDYFLIRKKTLMLEDLYSTDTNGAYFFTNGVNYKAMLAFAIGIFANLPGFLHAVDILPSSMLPACLALAYDCAWFVGVFFGGVAHFVLYTFF